VIVLGGLVAVSLLLGLAHFLYTSYKQKHTYELLPDQDGLDDNDDYLIN
jgi:hypothetical protein